VAVKGTWSDCTSPALLSTHGGRRQVYVGRDRYLDPQRGVYLKPTQIEKERV